MVKPMSRNLHSLQNVYRTGQGGWRWGYLGVTALRAACGPVPDGGCALALVGLRWACGWRAGGGQQTPDPRLQTGRFACLCQQNHDFWTSIELGNGFRSANIFACRIKGSLRPEIGINPYKNKPTDVMALMFKIVR